MIAEQYDEKAKTIAKQYDSNIIMRASHYFYTKETRSSYEIERETPSQERVLKFTALLKRISALGMLTKSQLIEIQNMIVDVRFADKDYRTSQNYVGENLSQYMQQIHYIAPKPENVHELMDGWLMSLEKLLENDVHPVVIAAAISFGFVLIHPFEDGNGRLHRFLIHYVLSKLRFSPEGIIFPVSAIMLKNRHQYDEVLESFSKPLMSVLTHYDLSDEGILTVNQPTHGHYKYIDYTKMAEYLFACIDSTLDEYFEKEVKFLVQYDQTKREIQSVVDMPDQLLDLFIKFVTQNNGELSAQKRIKYLHMLTDEEIVRLTTIVHKHLIQKS